MSSIVLYRKYRPLSFNQLIGQSHIAQILTQSVVDSTYSQGYLFSGPRGTGKTTTARLFAKALHCVNFQKSNDVCNECEFCKIIAENQTSDIIEMDAASNRGIDEIRELRENVHFMPSVLKHKVYIIDEAHMLTKEAFNALLKTLEEPPQHAIFILATTEPNKVPITIQSRLQRYDFKLGEQQDLYTKLEFIAKSEGVEIPQDSLKLIYSLSEGSYRDAESILNKVINSLGKKTTTEEIKKLLGVADLSQVVDFCDSISASDLQNIFQILTDLKNNNTDFKLFFEMLIDYIGENHINNSQLVKFSLECAKMLSQMQKYNDKLSYIKLFIANYLNSLNSVINSTPVEQISQPANKTPVPTTEKAPQAVPKQVVKEEKKVVSNKKVEGSELPSAVIDQIESEAKRLGIILKSSQLSIIKGDLCIKNEFQFNLNFILKPENTKIIRDVLKSNKIEIEEIKTEKEKPEPGTLVEQSISPTNSVIEEKKPEQVDNSEIVEELFSD